MENKEIIKSILNIIHESVKMQNKVAKNGVMIYDIMENNTDSLVLLILKIIKHDIGDIAIRHFEESENGFLIIRSYQDDKYQMNITLFKDSGIMQINILEI